MAQEPEYAPQYPMRERLVRVAIILVFAGAVIATCRLWLFPLWAEFAKTAHCRTVFGIAGGAVVMYVAFVAVPLGAGVSIGAFLIPSSLRCIRARHFPEPGKRMLGRVRVRKGRAAVVAAGGNLAMVAALFAIAIWGVFAATDVLQHAKPPDRRTCAGYHSSENLHRD